jgi:hypothetical protein
MLIVSALIVGGGVRVVQQLMIFGKIGKKKKMVCAAP